MKKYKKSASNFFPKTSSLLDKDDVEFTSPLSPTQKGNSRGLIDHCGRGKWEEEKRWQSSEKEGAQTGERSLPVISNRSLGPPPSTIRSEQPAHNPAPTTILKVQRTAFPCSPPLFHPPLNSPPLSAHQEAYLLASVSRLRFEPNPCSR